MNVGDGGIAVVTGAERLRRGVACILVAEGGPLIPPMVYMVGLDCTDRAIGSHWPSVLLEQDPRPITPGGYSRTVEERFRDFGETP